MMNCAQIVATVSEAGEWVRLLELPSGIDPDESVAPR
jgi:hypothetical protein